MARYQVESCHHTRHCFQKMQQIPQFFRAVRAPILLYHLKTLCVKLACRYVPANPPKRGFAKVIWLSVSRFFFRLLPDQMFFLGTHYAVCSPLTPGGTSYQPLQRSFLQPNVPPLARRHGYLVVRIEPVLNLALTSFFFLAFDSSATESRCTINTRILLEVDHHNCKLKSQQWTISHMHTRIDTYI